MELNLKSVVEYTCPQVWYQDPLSWHGLLLILAWVSNLMSSKVIVILLFHSQYSYGGTVEIWE